MIPSAGLRKMGAILGAAAFLAGCTDVMVRPGLPEYVQKLAVPVMQNRTSEPLLQDELTEQLTRDFLVDGRIRLVGADEANALLQGVITRYALDPLLLDVHNTPQQYKMRLVLRLALKDNQAGSTIWTEDEFEDSTTFYVANNLGFSPEDEPTARRRLIQQLSKRIVQRVIEGF
jgi:hypothetical protein